MNIKLVWPIGEAWRHCKDGKYDKIVFFVNILSPGCQACPDETHFKL